MFRSYILPVPTLLCLGAAILCAADFWQKKKYSEWSPDEVQKMLNDSPWARRVEIVAGEPRSVGSGGRSGGRPPSTSVDRSGRGGDTGPDIATALPRTTLLIRFHAALPIKQAIARGRFGDDVLKSPEAAKALSRQEETYIIGISGPPRLLAAEAAELKKQAQLVIKGRDPIQPEDVMIDRGQGGLTVYLSIPRAENPIKLEDDSFELRVKFPSFQLKHRFKLKEMVFDGRLEL